LIFAYKVLNKGCFTTTRVNFYKKWDDGTTQTKLYKIRCESHHPITFLSSLLSHHYYDNTKKQKSKKRMPNGHSFAKFF